MEGAPASKEHFLEGPFVAAPPTLKEGDEMYNWNRRAGKWRKCPRCGQQTTTKVCLSCRVGSLNKLSPVARLDRFLRKILDNTECSTCGARVPASEDFCGICGNTPEPRTLAMHELLLDDAWPWTVR